MPVSPPVGSYACPSPALRDTPSVCGERRYGRRLAAGSLPSNPTGSLAARGGAGHGELAARTFLPAYVARIQGLICRYRRHGRPVPRGAALLIGGVDCDS